MQMQDHRNELPIAQLTALQANLSKDPKKGKNLEIKDFCFFMPREDEDLPNGRFGAAAIKLIERGMFPSWALFCYSQLASGATEGYTPAQLAWMSDDAILLHPVPGKSPMAVQGMLIARESAGGKTLEFTSEKGETIMLTVPPIKTKIVAEENATLYKAVS